MCLLNLHVQRFKASEAETWILCTCVTQAKINITSAAFDSKDGGFEFCVSWPLACIEFTVAHNTATTACILTWWCLSTQNTQIYGAVCWIYFTQMWNLAADRTSCWAVVCEFLSEFVRMQMGWKDVLWLFVWKITKIFMKGLLWSVMYTTGCAVKEKYNQWQGDVMQCNLTWSKNTVSLCYWQTANKCLLTENVHTVPHTSPCFICCYRKGVY